MNDQPTSIRSILVNSEVESTIGNAQRMIDLQRKRILDTELDYATRKSNLQAQLADLDAEMNRRMPELHQQLQRLLAMRGDYQSAF